jgi:hypothetical protein
MRDGGLDLLGVQPAVNLQRGATDA